MLLGNVAGKDVVILAKIVKYQNTRQYHSKA